MRDSIRPSAKARADFPAPCRCVSSWASGNWPLSRRETRPARSLLMRLPRGSSPHIFMPQGRRNQAIECKAYGARVTSAEGLISDCARIVAERLGRAGSTTKEPYRIEGKKTRGIRAPKRTWVELPDAIFYPPGRRRHDRDVEGIRGSRKCSGRDRSERLEMIAVQEGCQPVVRAFERRPRAAGSGWRRNCRQRFASACNRRVVPRFSGGARAAAPLLPFRHGTHRCRDRISHRGGIFVSPARALACVVAARNLLRDGFLKRHDKVVLIYNTSAPRNIWRAPTTLPADLGWRDRQTRRSDHLSDNDAEGRMMSLLSNRREHHCIYPQQEKKKWVIP